MTKTTKDNSLISISKVHKCEIEGPEDYHFFYLNLKQQNKNLAYKIENIENDNDLQNDL